METPSEEQLIYCLQEAFKLHHSGNLTAAEQHYRELARMLPGSWQVLYNLGLVFHESGRIEEAIQTYHQALDCGADDHDLYFNLAHCYKQLGRFDRAIDLYRMALPLVQRDLDTSYNLAGCYVAAGRHEEARELYQSILEQDPGHLSALNNLAYLEHTSGNIDAALHLYRKLLLLAPGHASADYMVAVLTGQQRTSAPASYVEDVFDHYADHYEKSLVSELSYSVPDQMFKLVQDRIGRATFPLVLDLGCGTGLIGERFQASAERIHGVDLSRKMLAIAERKKCYDIVFHGTIEEFLNTCNSASYDLILAADVFTYIGDPRQIFSLSLKCAAANGWFFFSVEVLQQFGRSLQLGPTGRFAHADGWIRQCATDSGWIVEVAEKSLLRQEKGVWVAGMIYGLRRATSEEQIGLLDNPANQ